MQRNSGKTLRNKQRINQIQLHTVIQIITVTGKSFAETQAIIAYILSKINIWQDSSYLDVSKHNYSCKTTFGKLFMFFCNQDFFLLLRKNEVTIIFQKNTTKASLLISFELIRVHSHSTYANISNNLTPTSPLVCMRTFYKSPPPSLYFTKSSGTFE